MRTSVSPIVLVAIFAGILALVAIVVVFRMRATKHSRVGVALAVLPSVVMLALFYSLAIHNHMHRTPGAWPYYLGGRGSAAMFAQADISQDFFGVFGLAIHIDKSLGAYPDYIGERSPPAPLWNHAFIAMGCFSILLLVSIFVWPVVFLLCLFVRRWRVSLYYLGVYVLSWLMCFGALLLTPLKCFSWWWGD